MSAGRKAPAGAMAATGVAQPSLEALRAEIAALDAELLRLVAARVAVAGRIGRAKRAAGLPLLDPPREAAVVRRASELAVEAALPVEDVRAIFWHLVGLCRRAQEEG